MNTILVPTDFSPAAEHAALYAAGLASATGASVVLMHVYQLPVAMTDMPVLMVSAEDLKKGADKGLQRAKERLAAACPGVVIESEGRLGDVVEEVEDFCRSRKVLALVTGTKGLKGFERFVFGSTTLSLIKHGSHPVIAVPEGAALSAPKNMALAVDFLHLSEMPTAKILAFAEALQTRLHLIHIETENETTQPPAALLDALRVGPEAYHSFKEETVAQGLKHFAEQNHIDLITVLPHKHGLLDRLFGKGHTADILQAVSVPVMTVR